MVTLIGLSAGLVAYRWPESFMLSLRRLFVANLERVGQVELAILGEGDLGVPEGEPVMITAEARGAPSVRTWLLIRGQDDRLHPVTMTAAQDGSGVFSSTIPRARGTWQYQVRAGNSHTRWYTITAVPRPHVMNVEVVVEPPAYSGKPRKTFKSLPDTLKALRHTQIRLDVHTNKPIAHAVLQFDRDRPVELQPASGGENHYAASLTALDDASFRILLADEHKLDNVSPARHDIRVIRDEPPSVSISQPGRRVTLRTGDTLPIRFAARDDLAVTQAELIVTVGLDEPMTLPIKLPQAPQQRLESETMLDLGRFDVAHARQVSYRVRVSDSLPEEFDGGPQVAVSAEHEIMIDAAAQSFKMQVLKSVRRQFKAALDEVTALLKTSQKGAAALKDSAGKKQPYTSEQLEQTDKTRQALRDAEKLATEIHELTAYTDYRNLGRTLGVDVAQRHIAPAERLVVQARLLGEQHDQRADRFSRAEFEIQRALEKIAALAKQFDDTAVYQETAQALTDAAARQAALADRIRELAELDVAQGAWSPTTSQAAALEPAEGMIAKLSEDRSPTTGRADVATSRPTTQAGLAKMTEEQKELIDSIQGMISANPDLWQPALEAQQERSKTLLEQINDLAARQRSLAALVNEQHTRDKLKANRAELAKAQRALMAQVGKLLADRAQLVKQAGGKPVDAGKMDQAAGKVLGERMDEASTLQSQSADELAAIAKAAEETAKKLATSAPDPKPYRQLSALAKELSGLAVKLADRQRKLADKTAKTTEQRAAAQKALTESADKLTQRVAGLNQQQKALAGEAVALTDKVRKHPFLSSELAAALKKAEAQTAMQQASAKLDRKGLADSAPAQDSAIAKLDALGKAIAASAGRARDEGKQLEVETDKWSAAETHRQSALKAYQAEQARREAAMGKWRVAEADRKTALTKWQAEQAAKRKATTKQAAAKPPTTAAASSQPSGKGPSSKPATTQQAPMPEPPKALVTPMPQPTFPPLAKVPDTPAPKPKPKRPPWDEAQLKSADALAAESTSLTKRQQALRKKTASAVEQDKQWRSKAASLNDQAGKQDKTLLDRQQSLRKEADQLVTGSAKADPALAKHVEANSPIPSMAEAAKAIERHELAAAPKPQTAAAERLDALAKGLQGKSDASAAEGAAAEKAAADVRRQAAAQQDLAKQVNQLHKQQASLAKQAKAVGKRLAPLGANLTDKIVADLLRQQQELAKEATSLSDELAEPQRTDGVEMPPEPNPVAQSASMKAREATAALQAMTSDKGAKGEKAAKRSEQIRDLQEKSAGELDRLSERLQEPVEEDPARWEQQAIEDYLRFSHAERAAELASRQRRLSRQLERASAGKPMQAVAIEQDELRKKTADYAQAAQFLAEQVEVMEPKVTALKPKILANAQQATELLAKTAPTAMDAAAKALSQDQVAPAIQPMTDADKALKQAHKLLGTLQGQMAQAAKAVQAEHPSDEQMSKKLTESLMDQYEAYRRMLEAQQAAADAAAEGSTDPAQAAAQAMRERLTAQAARTAASANAARMQASAREFLEAAWEAAGEQNIDPDNAILVPRPPGAGGNWRIMIPDSKMLDLELIGLTRSDWARLPDTLREEMIQAAEDKAPAAYREVIKRYFKAISQRAGSGWDKPLLREPEEPKATEKPGAKPVK